MNYWKTSTVALTLALGVVAGGSFVKLAAAEGTDSQLGSALEHLNAAKTALKNAEQKHHHAHKAAVIATEIAIKSVEKEIEWEAKHPTAPKDPPTAPKDPPTAPKDPPTAPKQPPTAPKN